MFKKEMKYVELKDVVTEGNKLELAKVIVEKKPTIKTKKMAVNTQIEEDSLI